MSTYRQQAIEDVAKDVGAQVKEVAELVDVSDVCPNLTAYAVSQRERVLELEAALKATEWQEIREGNLPKAGDEVWSATQNQYIPHGDMLLRNGVYVVEEPTVMISYYSKLKFTHFRPVNAPSAARAKEGK